MPMPQERSIFFATRPRSFWRLWPPPWGGLDTLIFTAGIGENSPASRWRICEGVEFLGIYLDSCRNDANAPVISRKHSPCIVRVMRTDEDLMIARHAHEQIREKSEEPKQGPKQMIPQWLDMDAAREHCTWSAV